MSLMALRFVFILLSALLAAAPVLAAEQNKTSITVQGSYRFIVSNGIPNHGHGNFPNPHNPNTISAQHYNFRVPVNPQLTGSLSPLGMYPFGVAVNGIPFDPGAAEWWNNNRNSGWQYEALGGSVDLGVDQNNAHVQPTGAYHYHGLPTGLITYQGTEKHSMLLGYAADGFPIYALYGYKKADDAGSGIKRLASSYRIKSGTRPGGPGGKYDGAYVQDYEYVKDGGDLDECNGRTGVTPDYPQGTYYYVITEKYPYIPRCFRGTPDASFFRKAGSARHHGPPPGGMRQPRPPGHEDRPPPPPRFPGVPPIPGYPPPE